MSTIDTPDHIERHQSIRLKRFGIALSTYLIWVVLALFLDWKDLFELTVAGVDIPVWAISIGMLVSNAAFYAVLRSGANLRFSDPSLSLGMMMMATFWAIVFAGGTAEVRGVNLITFMMVFLFGIFNLRVREYLFCWLVAVGGYVLIVFMTLPAEASPEQVALEAMYAVLLACVLFWSVLFGYYVGRLRDKLAVRNAELKKTMALLLRAVAHDDLTGVHNRRAVMTALEQQHQRLDRYGAGYALLMLDLDHFKEINDTYGHGAGDAVLKNFAGRVTEQVRGVDLIGRGDDSEDDTIGRFGGEEFLVILPDTDAKGALHVAERIREAVADKPFDSPAGSLDVTVSVGVAEALRGQSMREMLDRVDNAMYTAKHAGRNRIALAGPSPESRHALYTRPGSTTSTDTGK